MGAQDRPSGPGAGAGSRLSWEFGSYLFLFAAMVVMSLVAEPSTRDHRVTQSGLLSFVLFTALLVPVRVRWWFAVQRDLHAGHPTRWGKYPFSGRFFLDASIALAIVAFVFILDLKFWPQHTIRLGVATAISLVGLMIGVLIKPRKEPRE
jgi:hypothetical protein